jgi:hypothetical protein
MNSHFELQFDLRKRKSFATLQSSKQKERVIEFLYMNFLFYFQLILGSFGLEIRSIELGQCESIYSIPDQELSIYQKKRKLKKFLKILKINIDYYGASNNPDDSLMKIQAVKDKTNQSNKAYGLFRNTINELLRQSKKNFELPSKYKLNTFKVKLNKFYDIKSNRFGCYVDVKEKVYFTLKKISEHLIKNGQNIKNNVFDIHLSGDGCTITRTFKNFINFTFKVLNENDHSTSGLYTLGN